jgi:hypothetical protein
VRTNLAKSCLRAGLAEIVIGPDTEHLTRRPAMAQTPSAANAARHLDLIDSRPVPLVETASARLVSGRDSTLTRGEVTRVGPRRVSLWVTSLG